ncbi:hypothetical protein ACJJIR_08305 [Microbulbifer sp. SSSA008]|uniref:hypothetical protein n=1 Tax=Microbulbifer sp. SSSA008 TaxID=3243380 RepID=UPI00403A2319
MQKCLQALSWHIDGYQLDFTDFLYKKYGFLMKRYLLLGLLVLPSLVFAGAGDIKIVGPMAGPTPIEIKTCDHDAGAVCSLTWRGKQFINDYDHGRQMQSACHFDGLGEAYNPTEAGSYWDGKNPSPSSSDLLGYWSIDNRLATTVDMAFWRSASKNASQPRGYKLSKDIEIGVHNINHAIRYSVAYTIPAGYKHDYGYFETLTGYMPAEFSEFYAFDKSNNSLNRLSDNPGATDKPIIASTPDGGWAMGVYTPDIHDSTWFRYYDAITYHSQGVVKWNSVFKIDSPSAGTYNFKSYVVVGTLENTRVALKQLHAYFNE